MYERRITDIIEGQNSASRSYLRSFVHIEGEIIGENELIFAGKCAGSITIKALFVLEENGEVQGEIRAENAVIEGKVMGDIVVLNKLEIRSKAYIEGDIMCQQVAIAEGAFFRGNIKMENGQNIVPIFFKEKRRDIQKKKS